MLKDIFVRNIQLKNIFDSLVNIIIFYNSSNYIFYLNFKVGVKDVVKPPHPVIPLPTWRWWLALIPTPAGKPAFEPTPSSTPQPATRRKKGNVVMYSNNCVHMFLLFCLLIFPLINNLHSYWQHLFTQD